jgi:hypothetical protein
MGTLTVRRKESKENAAYVDRYLTLKRIKKYIEVSNVRDFAQFSG